tara:strand:- start:488 stop:772 length:285 start_codon:yes stop_codon:yes gene_type:complete
MEKFITITDTTTGQKRLIDLTRIAGFSSTSTQLTIEYLHPSADNAATYVITHDTAPNSGAFRTWFVDQMEVILATDWKHVTAEPTPPYKVTNIT